MSGPSVPDQNGNQGVAARKKRPLLIAAAGALAGVIAAGAGIGLALSGPTGEDAYGYLTADSTPRTLTCSAPSNSQAISNLTSVELRKNDSTGLTLAVKYSDLFAWATIVGEEAQMNAYFERGKDVDKYNLPLHSITMNIYLDYRQEPEDYTSGDMPDEDALLIILEQANKDVFTDTTFSVVWGGGIKEEDWYQGVAAVKPSGEFILSIPPNEAGNLPLGNLPLGKRPTLRATSEEWFSRTGDQGPRYVSVQECRETEDLDQPSVNAATPTTAVAAPEPVRADTVGASDDPQAALTSLLERDGIPAPGRLVAHLDEKDLPKSYCTQLATGTGMPPESSASPSKRWNWVTGGLGQSVMYVYGQDNASIVNQTSVNQILRDITTVYCPDQVQ